MHRFHVFGAASAAVLLAATSSVHAATQIYNFNGSTFNGFSRTYAAAAGSTVTRSTTTGVSEGTGALHIHVGTAAGYTQTDAGTATVPSSLILPGTTSDNLDVTTNYGDAPYLFITQVFFIEGTTPDPDSPGDTVNVDKKLIPVGIDNDPLSPANTASAKTLTFNLKNYTDPFTDVDGNDPNALYTPGQILAAVQAASPGSNLSIPTFAFETFNGANTTGVDFYIDNVTVPSTPEPASLAGLVIGGGLLAKRRRNAR